MTQNLLLIDTATERGIVSIFEDGRSLFHEDLPFGLNNSKYLLPKIQEGLHVCSLQPADLDAIACGVGPGSYTGMRVGAMTAKTLSFALGTPLIGICTLQEFLPAEDGPFAVLIDAKIAGAYVITGKKEGEIITYTSEPQVQPIEALPAILEGIRHLVTPKADRLSKLLKNLQCKWEQSWPDAHHMARLAREKQQAGNYSSDGSLELLYLRSIS